MAACTPEVGDGGAEETPSAAAEEQIDGEQGGDIVDAKKNSSEVEPTTDAPSTADVAGGGSVGQGIDSKGSLGAEQKGKGGGSDASAGAVKNGDGKGVGGGDKTAATSGDVEESKASDDKAEPPVGGVNANAVSTTTPATASDAGTIANTMEEGTESAHENQRDAKHGKSTVAGDESKDKPQSKGQAGKSKAVGRKKAPVFLFFSVHQSAQFCGVAQLSGPMDHGAKKVQLQRATFFYP